MREPVLFTIGHDLLEAVDLRGDHGGDLGFVLHSSPDGTDLSDFRPNMEPCGAFSLDLPLVQPEEDLELMRDVPKTPLKENRHLTLEPLEDGGVSVGHQKKRREFLQDRKTLGKEILPGPVVGADIDYGHPNAPILSILDENLELLSTLLDAPDPDSRSVGLSMRTCVRIQGKLLFGSGFLDRLPYCHLVDHRPEGRHELLSYPVGRKRPKKPKLSPNFVRDPLVPIEPQEFSGEVKLVSALPALHLNLLDRHPEKGRQDLCFPSLPGLPD